MVDTTQYLVSFNRSGLCNRLKNILSVLRVAGQHGCAPLVYWPRNEKVACDFGDLIQSDLPVINDAGAMRRLCAEQRWRLHTRYDGRMGGEPYQLLSTWRLVTLHGDLAGASLRVDRSPDGRGIDFQYEAIPTRVCEAYGALLRTWRPAEAVREGVEACAREFDEGTVAVSVRSWPDARQRQALFRIEQFFAVLDGLRDRRFFLSVDDPAVVDAFRARYGTRLLESRRRTAAGDRGSSAGMRDIMVDLLLLSRCRTMVVSHLSTFPEMAWWFGGCRAGVTVLGDERVLWRLQRRYRMTSRLEEVTVWLRNCLRRNPILLT